MSSPRRWCQVDGETTILDIALGNLAAVDLREVVVIVGYQAQAVVDRKAAPWKNATACNLTPGPQRQGRRV